MLKWRKTADGKIDSSPAVDPADGSIYVTSWSKALIKFDPEGVVIWRGLTDNVISSSPGRLWVEY